jgi:dienelactone hydrolase
MEQAMRVFLIIVCSALLACSGTPTEDLETAASGTSSGGQGGAAQGGAAQGGSSSTNAAGGLGMLTVEPLADGSFECTPAGNGPFAGVLYNHGGLGTAVGGDLEATCKALAEAGYIGYAKKRRETVPLAGHLDDVLAGLDDLRGHTAIDTTRVGIMGFSRGGLLTLQASIARAEQLSGAVIMAPAAANSALDQTLMDVSAIDMPVVCLVAANDNAMADHVAHCQQVTDTLNAAGKGVNMTTYPAFGSDGHQLFFEVREPYWSDVIAFFDDAL